jgi:hypothetical protein
MKFSNQNKIISPRWIQSPVSEHLKALHNFSLSPRERAGVRGKAAQLPYAGMATADSIE